MVIAAIKFQSCGYSKFVRREFSLAAPANWSTSSTGTNIKYMRAGAVSFFPRGNDNKPPPPPDFC